MLERERILAEQFAPPALHRRHVGMIIGRDAVEFILEAKGILEKVIDEYIDERNPISPAMDIGKGVD